MELLFFFFASIIALVFWWLSQNRNDYPLVYSVFATAFFVIIAFIVFQEGLTITSSVSQPATSSTCAVIQNCTIGVNSTCAIIQQCSNSFTSSNSFTVLKKDIYTNGLGMLYLIIGLWTMVLAALNSLRGN